MSRPRLVLPYNEMTQGMTMVHGKFYHALTKRGEKIRRAIFIHGSITKGKAERDDVKGYKPGEHGLIYKYCDEHRFVLISDLLALGEL